MEAPQQIMSNEQKKLNLDNVLKVIDILSGGGTQKSAAKTVGISETRMSQWIREARLGSSGMNPDLKHLRDYLLAADTQDLFGANKTAVKRTLLDAATKTRTVTTTRYRKIKRLSKQKLNDLAPNDQETVKEWLEDADSVLYDVEVTEK